MHTFDIFMNTFILLLNPILNLLESQLFTLTVPDNRHNVRIKGEQLAVEENSSVLFDIHKDT